jgi:very-short-patch-repair endonuclease
MNECKTGRYSTQDRSRYARSQTFSEVNKRNATRYETRLITVLRKMFPPIEDDREHIPIARRFKSPVKEQHIIPIQNHFYILDIYIVTHKLAIEVDGSHHQNNPAQKHYDIVRDQELNLEGIRVLRFTNNQVYSNLKSVLETIQKTCKVQL